MLYRNHLQLSLEKKGWKQKVDWKNTSLMTACLTDTITYRQTNKDIGKFNWKNALVIYAVPNVYTFSCNYIWACSKKTTEFFQWARLSVCDSYNYCSRCVHPLSMEKCKNVWIYGEKFIWRMLWETTVLKACEDVSTSGIITEILMWEERWMGFEKPDPASIGTEWSKVKTNDKVQQIYGPILFPGRSQLAENESCPCFPTRTYFKA